MSEYMALWMLTIILISGNHYSKHLSAFLSGMNILISDMGYEEDDLSDLLMILSNFLSLIVLFMTWSGWDTQRQNVSFTLLSGVLGVFFSTDNLFILILAMESTVLPMLYLISFYGPSYEKLSASLYLTFYTLISALPVLMGIFYLLTATGSLEMTYLQCQKLISWNESYLWWTLAIAFIAKLPLIPLAIWLPLAHVESPLAGSVLLAGILLKMGVYGYISVNLTLCPWYSMVNGMVMTIFGMVSMLGASLATLSQTDIKSLVAYSSIAHMGFIGMALGNPSNMAQLAALYMSLTHAFSSSMLFCLVTYVYYRYGTRLMRYYRGLGVFMPTLSTFMLLANLANFGFPVTGNFHGELGLLASVWPWSQYLSVLTCVILILSASYALLLNNAMTFGFPMLQSTPDLSRKETQILGPFLGLTLITGFYGGFMPYSL